MNSVGPHGAGAGANNNDGGNVAWANPTNAVGAQNGTLATAAALTQGQTSQRLRLSNTPLETIPSTATIAGILVEVWGSSGVDISGNQIKLLWGGSGTPDGSPVEVGTGKSGGRPTAAWGAYGSSSDLWGTTLTPADVNGTGFGVSLKYIHTPGSGAGEDVSVDAVRFTVYYRFEGSATFSETITLTTAGVRRRVGVSAIAETLSIVTAGVRRRVGTSAIAETFSIAVEGVRRLVGTATFAETFTIAVAGVRRLVGSATFDETLTISTAGVRRVVGSCTFGVGVEFECVGALRAAGAVDLAATLDIATVGVRRQSSTATLPLDITYTVAGDRRLVGSVDFPLVFTIGDSGLVVAHLRARAGHLTFPEAGELEGPLAGKVSGATTGRFTRASAGRLTKARH